MLTNRGRLSTALGIHGLTAGLLVAAGLVRGMVLGAGPDVVEEVKWKKPLIAEAAGLNTRS